MDPILVCARGVLVRLAAAIAFCLASLALLSSPVAAQEIKPLDVVPDPNGVDLLRVNAQVRLPELSIPAAPELSFRSLDDFFPLLKGTPVPRSETGDVTFSVNAGGIASDGFRCFDGPGSCVGAAGSGAVLNGGGNVGPFYYTQGGTGKQIYFSLLNGDQGPPQPGIPFYYLGTTVFIPGQATLDFTYESGKPFPGYGVISYRPSVVTSSSGYQLKFTYLGNDPTKGTWMILSKAEIVKTSNPTVPLASLTYSGTHPNYIVKDIGNREYQCTNCQISLIGPQPGTSHSQTLPGEALPNFQVADSGTSPGRIITVTNDGVAYTYNAADDPAFGERDAFDYVTITAPDGFYRRVEITNFSNSSCNVYGCIYNPPRGRIDSITDSQNNTTRYEYDNSQRVTKITYPEGNSVEVVYDSSGNITSTTTRAKPGSIEALNGPSALTQLAHYNSGFYCDKVNCFLPVWTRDAKGNQTDYTWGLYHGGLLTQLDPADESGRRRKVKNSYMGDRLTREEICETDINGNELTCGTVSSFVRLFTYFGATRLPLTETVTDGAGNGPLTTTFGYDDAGRLLWQDGPLAGDNDRVSFHYDTLGRKVWEVGALGQAGTRPATRTSYRDADDQVTKVEAGYVNAAGSIASFEPTAQTETEYNTRRLAVKSTVSSVTPTAITPYSVTQAAYGARNRLECTAVRMNPAVFGNLPASACAVGPDGSNGPDRITVTVYGVNDKVYKKIEAYGTSLQRVYATYSYTPNGQVASMTDARGYKASMLYDGFDRQTHWYFPSKTQTGAINMADYEQYGYDANGNRTSLRKRDGSVITYQYDKLNRVTVKAVPERAGLDPVHTRDVYYRYDIRGLQDIARFGSLSGEGVQTFYDTYGRVARNYTTIDGVGRDLWYQYDANGNRTRVTWPDGNFFDYRYDAAGRSTQIVNSAGIGIAGFYYDVQGRLSQRASGSWSLFAYDPIGRLSSQTEDMGGTAGDVTWAFTRNPASQILTESQSNDAYSWNAFATVDRDYQTNGLNQYTTAGSASFTYDANGNLTSDGAKSYLYDVENRLVQVTDGPYVTHLYYDPMGRLYRTASTRPGYGTTVYLHDGDALVAEYDAAGTMLRRHVHGAAAGVDDPLATFAGSGTDGSTAALLKADPRGSIVATTDWNGNLQVINTYDVYGIPGTTNSGRFQYTGQVWLPEIGLYYYKARIYSPSLGRFLQTDPIGYEDDSNLYAYVGGDPVNNTDFLGLCTDEDKKCLKENVIVVRAPKRAGTGVPARSSVRRAPAGRKVVPDKKVPQKNPCVDSQGSALNIVREGAEWLSVGADGLSIVTTATGVGAPIGGLVKGAQIGLELGLLGINAYDAYVNGNSAPLAGQVSGGLARLAPGGRIVSRAARSIRGQPRNALGQFRRSKIDSAAGQQAIETAQGRAVGGAVQGGVCLVQ